MTRRVEAWEEGGKPGCPKQRRWRLPKPSGWADVPRGAGSGRAWPPGLQRPGSGSGSGESWLRGRGQGALGAETGLSQSRRGKRNRLGCLDAGWEGVAGKAREGSRPGTRPPPFFGSLTGRGGGGLLDQDRPCWWERGSRACGHSQAALQEPSWGRADQGTDGF